MVDFEFCQKNILLVFYFVYGENRSKNYSVAATMNNK